ncbi:hypothetical protein BKI51_08760 [Alphaproteobacteria bacterium AO1-B]|nr:hypothetical protein BKI51_08760 [Alphaproteobacteria bacterium AO1-B]
MATSRIRFTKASQVFETYPDLVDLVPEPQGEMEPETYLADLRKQDPAFAALAFFAHVLPKRESVWWAHQCVVGLQANLSSAETNIMRLAEAWVRDGDEESREAVQKVTDPKKPDTAPVWVGLAAVWSSGSLSPNPDYRVETPDDLTAKAVHTAVLIAVGQVGPTQRKIAIDTCLDAGLMFARGDSMPPVRLSGTSGAQVLGTVDGGG